VLRRLRDNDGTAVAEFVMVGGLLTLLTLSVMQLGLARRSLVTFEQLSPGRSISPSAMVPLP
jgi:hypothetical protein